MYRTRILPAVAASALTGLLGLGLAACAEPQAVATASFEEAKARTLELENKIASYVPAENVKSSSQNQMSRVLIACVGANGLSYWPGTTNLSLHGEINEEAIIAKIAAHFSADPEWTIERVPDAEGTPSLVLTSNQGYEFTADYFGGPVFTIKSRSACFPTSEVSELTEY